MWSYGISILDSPWHSAQVEGMWPPRHKLNMPKKCSVHCHLLVPYQWISYHIVDLAIIASCNRKVELIFGECMLYCCTPSNIWEVCSCLLWLTSFYSISKVFYRTGKCIVIICAWGSLMKHGPACHVHLLSFYLQTQQLNWFKYSFLNLAVTWMVHIYQPK